MLSLVLLSNKEAEEETHYEKFSSLSWKLVCKWTVIKHSSAMPKDRGLYSASQAILLEITIYLNEDWTNDFISIYFLYMEILEYIRHFPCRYNV